MFKKIILSSALLVPLFIIDRLTKYLATTKLPDEGVFISGFLNLKLFINPNLALSLPLSNILAVVLSLIILTLLIYFLFKKGFGQNILTLIMLGLIVIGAFSNLLDRLKVGGVIDFINFSYFPAFNLSDVYIFCGAVLLLIVLKSAPLPKILK